MSQRVRTNQGGSVLSFIIVAVVLLLVVVGGIYLVRRTTGTAQDQAVSPDASRTSPETTPAPVVPTDDKKDATPPASQPSTPQNTTTPSPSKQSPATLPQTGPVETTISGIIFAILTGTVVSYGRSKRSLSSL